MPFVALVLQRVYEALLLDAGHVQHVQLGMTASRPVTSVNHISCSP